MRSTFSSRPGAKLRPASAGSGPLPGRRRALGVHAVALVAALHVVERGAARHRAEQFAPPERRRPAVAARHDDAAARVARVADGRIRAEQQVLQRCARPGVRPDEPHFDADRAVLRQRHLRHRPKVGRGERRDFVATFTLRLVGGLPLVRIRIEQRLAELLHAELADRALRRLRRQPLDELLRRREVHAGVRVGVDRHHAVAVAQARIGVLGDRTSADEHLEVRQLLAHRQPRPPVRHRVGPLLVRETSVSPIPCPSDRYHGPAGVTFADAQSASSAVCVPDLSPRLANGACGGRDRRERLPRRLSVPATFAGSAAGPTMTKSLYMMSSRSRAWRSATNFTSSRYEWTRTTSVSPRRPSSSA